MPDDTLALDDPSFAAESEALAASRAETAAREEREKMLKKKGRLPGQQHIPLWQFMVVGLAAVINDGIDLVEVPAIGAATTVVGVALTVAVKVGLIVLDAATAFFIMAWSFSWGKGFFSARRIATFLAVTLAEVIPGIGVVPGWTLYVVIEYALQKGRETAVKGLAKIPKVGTKIAAKAATTLESAQKVAEKSAAGIGKGAMTTLKGAPALRGAVGAERQAALAARGTAGQAAAGEAREVARAYGQKLEQYAPGYGKELVRDIKERVAPASQEAARKMGGAIQERSWSKAKESIGDFGKALGAVPMPQKLQAAEAKSDEDAEKLRKIREMPKKPEDAGEQKKAA